MGRNTINFAFSHKMSYSVLKKIVAFTHCFYIIQLGFYIRYFTVGTLQSVFCSWDITFGFYICSRVEFIFLLNIHSQNLWSLWPKISTAHFPKIALNYIKFKKAKETYLSAHHLQSEFVYLLWPYHRFWANHSSQHSTRPSTD